MTMKLSLRSFRRTCLSAGVAVALLFGGCASFGLDDVPVYVSAVGRVVDAVAAAEKSRRVTEAQRRCGQIEEAMSATHDVETAATLIRELAAAHVELADALEEDARPPTPADGGI